MALIFADSFNSYSAASATQLLNRYFSVFSGSTFSFSAGPSGSSGRAISIAGSSASRGVVISKPASAFRFGAYVTVATSASASRVLSFGGYLNIGYLGQIGVGLGSSVTPSGDIVIKPGTWAWVEVIVDTNQVRVFVNGLLRGTANGATTISTQFSILGPNTATEVGTFAHFVLYDTTGSSMNAGPYGPMFVECIVPNGAGDSTQWTPTNAAVGNWANVNAAGWGSGSGVTSTVNGQKDLYAMRDISWTPYKVMGFQAFYQAMDSNSGGSSLTPVFTLPSGEVELPTMPLPVVSSEIFSTAYTSESLTVSDINAMQMGFKSVIP